MLSWSSLCLALSIFSTEALAKGYTPEQWSQYCFYSVYDSLSSLTWGTHTKRTGSAQECTNSALVTSIYASCKVYCSPLQFEAGLESWKELCQYDKSTLMDLSNVTNTVTDSYVTQLTIVDPELNSTAKLTEPVLLHHSYFMRVYKSYKLKFEASPRSKRFGWALICYWAGILTLGVLKAGLDSISSRRGLKKDPDVEKAGFAGRAVNNAFAPLESASFWFKTHVLVPAALGTRCQQTLFGCTIPQRSVSLCIGGFWCLCIILGFSGYPTVAGNTLTPNIHQYLWNTAAVRCGYLAYSLLPWVWVFAQRNNIFIWATGWSYQTFNIFHRHCARAATIFGIVHGISYSVVYARYKYTYHTSLQKHWFQFGIVAIILMSLLLVLSVSFLRLKSYETFLIIHISLSVVVLYSLFTHTSKFTDGEYNVYLWPLVAVWAFDRLLRLLRLLYCNFRAGYGKSVSATVRYSAATDVIRIHIQSSSLPLRPGPGQYYHLYQPFALKGWENHPFSLGAYSIGQEASSRAQQSGVDMASSKDVSTTAAATGVVSSSSTSSSSLSNPPGADDFVFWVRPYDGWTRRLRDQCLKSTGSETSIEPHLLIEGPYGHSKPLHTFDTVVLIAGGTGIAAAAPYVLDHQARCSSASRRTRTTKMKLVWVVKQAAFIRDVCRNELAATLRREDSQCVLFATGGSADGGDGSGSGDADGVADEGVTDDAAGQGFEIQHGRPDVAAVVAEAAQEATESGAKTVVFVCGPAGMVDETRAAVHREMKKGCRSISYVEECFGW